jgi:hypothetical protein
MSKFDSQKGGMTMKRSLTLLSIAALAFSVATPQPARAVTPPYGVMQGTWAFGSNYYAEDYGEAGGSLTFNGNGGVTGILNAASDGVYCVGMGLTGTYVVNPGKLSGTATMTISSVTTGNCANAGNGDTLTIAFNLANNFKTFTYVEMDPDTTGYFIDTFGGPISGPATHF